jgi:hypothetical protein
MYGQNVLLLTHAKLQIYVKYCVYFKFTYVCVCVRARARARARVCVCGGGVFGKYQTKHNENLAFELGNSKIIQS